MDKRNPADAPRVATGSVRVTLLQVPRNTMGIDAKGNAVTYALNTEAVARFRQLWADVERFGTVRRAGTLEEFFRQRKESQQ